VRKFGSARAITQEAIVANALKAVRQDMKEKAAEEFACGQGHELLLVVMPIVFPAEGDGVLLQAHQPMIGDGDPVGVAAQIIEDLLGAAKGWLGVHDPLGGTYRSEVRGKGPGIGQRLQRREEVELMIVERRLQVP
jgi:hypothetical protein